MANNGKIYLTGLFSDTAYFDSLSFVSPCISTLFISEHDSLGNITFIKTAKCADSTSYSVGRRILVDSANNIYLVGRYRSFYLDSTFYAGSWYDFPFLLKLNTSRNIDWFVDDDFTTSFNDFALDNEGNTFVAASDAWTLGGPAWFIKYNYKGQFAWRQYTSGGCHSYSSFTGIQPQNGNFYLVGQTELSQDCNTAHSDLLIQKFDSAGNSLFYDTLFLGLYGATYFSQDIARISQNEFIMAGVMNGLCIVGSDTIKSTEFKVFVAKLSDRSVNSINTFRRLEKIVLYPNPSLGIFTINMNNGGADVKVSVRDVVGNCLLERSCRGDTREQIDLSGHSKGMYFVEVCSENEKIVRKVVIQ